MAKRIFFPRAFLTGIALVVGTAFVLVANDYAQDQRIRVGTPRNFVEVKFIPATDISFPNDTDSNSPAIWDGDDFYIFNSSGGPRRAKGTRLEDAQDTNPGGLSSRYTNNVGRGRWLEAAIKDDSTGRTYGWYHEEIGTRCPQGWRFWPVIGAAASEDDGENWDDLGIIITPRRGSVTCDTEHPVTNGGVGDFSVILDNNLDAGDHYLYFLFSSYGGELKEQGVSFARMLWIDRDRPLDRYSGESQAFKWYRDLWTEPGIGGYSTAIFDDSEKVSWTSLENNGFWGPSVHWNTSLKRFVMLMSRSKGGNYESGGIFMSYTQNLHDPPSWAEPKKIVEGGGYMWYPQVIGEPEVHGTDKLSGKKARYFDSGHSNSLIEFIDKTPPRITIPPGEKRILLEPDDAGHGE